MYKFCNPFEGSKERDYVMRVGLAQECGQVITYDGDKEFVIMCQEHINANQEETLRLKMENNKQLAQLGIPSEVYPEDYYEGTPELFEMSKMARPEKRNK